MNGMISIKTQRILMYLPLLNFLNLFIWVYNCLRKPYGFEVFAKSFGVMLMYTLPIVFVQILASKIFVAYSLLVTIVDCVAIYFVPLSLSFGLIRLQRSLNTE